MITSLQALKRGIDRIVSGKAKKTKHDPESRIAHLTKHVLLLTAELRKMDTAEAKSLDVMTKKQVIVWARRLTAADRAALRRDLDAIDAEGSVLA